MTYPEPTIRMNVDVTNPGQFFACCGLLELADRLWPGAEGWFQQQTFLIASTGSLPELLREVCHCPLTDIHPEEATSTPVQLGHPFNLRLDWWLDDIAGGRELKVWAGSMEGGRIARAMQQAFNKPALWSDDLFDFGTMAYDTENPAKKVEPFYFDARRGPNAHSRDVGFSANDLQLPTTASPCVELLCLVGLQRVIPVRTQQPRIFDYHVWDQPTPAALLPLSVSGSLRSREPRPYRFENWYRTGQRKHKAFRPATPLIGAIDE
jgi:CRISPR-associated protein Csb3